MKLKSNVETRYTLNDIKKRQQQIKALEAFLLNVPEDAKASDVFDKKRELKAARQSLKSLLKEVL